MKNVIFCVLTLFWRSWSKSRSRNQSNWKILKLWMNEWCIYIAIYCVLLYTKSALQSCVGGGGGDLSSTTTSVQHPLGWCDGCHRTTAPVRSPHTGYRWRGESHSANQVYALTKTSYRWRGERDIDPIKCMLSPKPATGGEEERDIDPIKCMLSPKPATGGEERET